jgi:alpha-methylacyl-CoA racemase
MGTVARQPDRGPTVVAVVTNVPGPVAAARLADAGCSVVKVEPLAGDPLEKFAPAWYRELVAKMEVIRLDLRADEGHAEFFSRLKSADLLITSMRPQALSRLGLDSKTLEKSFGSLCWVRIFGQPQPHADLPGHDLTYQARAGLIVPPTLPYSLFADLVGGERAAFAGLRALYFRDRGANAQIIDISLAECAQELARPLSEKLTTADGVLGGANPGYQLYRSSDGWIAVAALEEHFRARLATELRLAELRDELMAQIFAEHSSSYWEDWGAARDIPVASVLKR